MPRFDDLSHVPRRAVGMAKDLRRMGLYVVTRAGKILREEGDEEMSSDVKYVTEAAREIADVGRHARTIAENLQRNIADVREALGIAEEVSAALGDAAAELRGVLGAQTNRPPKDENK